MTENTTETNVVTPATDSPKEDIVPSHDPVKAELEKEKAKGQSKSELEKAIYTKQKLDERIARLKGESGEDITITTEPDDSQPLTVGQYREIQKQEAQRTALQMADEIEDESERELVKIKLQTRVVPSGNPAQDLRDARLMVNSIKNAQIAEELGRKSGAKNYPSGSGSPARVGDKFEPTAEEENFMRTFKLTEEQIKQAREKEAAKQR